jgi:hypothetical protein
MMTTAAARYAHTMAVSTRADTEMRAVHRRHRRHRRIWAPGNVPVVAGSRNVIQAPGRFIRLETDQTD